MEWAAAAPWQHGACAPHKGLSSVRAALAHLNGATSLQPLCAHTTHGVDGQKEKAEETTHNVTREVCAVARGCRWVQVGACGVVGQTITVRTGYTALVHARSPCLRAPEVRNGSHQLPQLLWGEAGSLQVDRVTREDSAPAMKEGAPEATCMRDALHMRQRICRSQAHGSSPIA